MFEGASGIGTILLMIVVLIGILVLAYFTTRLVGRRYQMGMAPHDIKVIERMPVDQNASLLLVQVAGKIYLLGATQHHIERIDDVDAKTLTPREQGHSFAQTGKSFAETFKGMLKGNHDQDTGEENTR